MNKEEARILIRQGRANEVDQYFQEHGYSSTPEAILASLDKLNARQIYGIFLEVLDLTSSDNIDINFENTRKIKEYLKAFIPHEIVDSPDCWDKKISEYLEFWKDRVQLFKYFWESLKFVGGDDLTVGTAWTAVLHLSI